MTEVTKAPLKLPAAIYSPSTPLTATQDAFVDHYIRYRNATQAYKAATSNDVAYSTAHTEGYRLLRNEAVQEAIKARAKLAYADSTASTGWLLQRFLDMATADPRELIGLKIGCCRYCHGDDHLYQWREREYLEALQEAETALAIARPALRETIRLPDIGGGLDFNATLSPDPNCPQCHGEGVERVVPRDTDQLSDQALLLFGGVKVKNGSLEIIIADRTKALENVGRIMGAFTDKLQHTGSLGALVAVTDLQKMDPVAAARAYRDMIAGNMAT